MIVRVIDPTGAYLCKYGSREIGQTFDNIPDDVALDICATYPTIFELVEPPESEPPEEQE